MKQEKSVLQWGSLMLQQNVKTLDSVQNVAFLKNLLQTIDPDYFNQWQKGKGSENLSQVMKLIEKYFRQQIGTDIQEQIDNINIFKHPMEVWELLLGVAIKGNKRGQNIALILDMDHEIQAELVGIVSNIIDKFGQNAAQTSLTTIEEDAKEEPSPASQQMFMDLVKENEQLNNQVTSLLEQVDKLKQENTTLTNQKKQVQNQLFMLKNEKTAFINILSASNRTDSRIFDDGQENVLHSPSLSELANDLTIFVRGLKTKLAREQQKIAHMQYSLKEAQRQVIKITNQNQTFIMQLGKLNSLERECEELKQKMEILYIENEDLMNDVDVLREEKARVMENLQLKEKISSKQEQETAELEKKEQFVNKHRKTEKAKKKKDQASEENSQDSRPRRAHKSIYGSDSGFNIPQKTAMNDDMVDLNEFLSPDQRNKFQKQLKYLKKENQYLHKQNNFLKIANQSLQNSTQQFMQTNKQIIGRWEDDYQQLLSKMNQLTESQHKQMETVEIQAQEQPKQTSEIAIQFNDPPEKVETDNFDESKPQESTSVQFGINTYNNSSKKQQESLWEEISIKMREIIRKGKERQCALHNTIHSLRLENAKLLEIIQEKQRLIANPSQESIFLINQQPAPRPSILSNSQVQYAVNIVKANTADIRSNEDIKPAPRMSFLSIKEGEDMDESMIEKRRLEGASFYNVGSKFLQGITQKKVMPSQIDSRDDNHLNLNRALFKSIRANLQLNKSAEQVNNKSSELQQKLKTEINTIQSHYHQLNKNYQLVFNKLKLYSQQFNQAEVVKQEHHKILEQLKLVEEQIKADQQSQIIKLRLKNDHLHQDITQAIIEKQEILQSLNALLQDKQQLKAAQQQHYQSYFKIMTLALQDIKNKYESVMIEPMQFLSALNLQGNKEQETQKFYQMYLKEKEKNKQLNNQLELLSATLVEFNNIIHY